MADPVKPAGPWWRTGVLYQIYPRSFADSNRDGIGDLQGVLDHLDHLAWLGVDGIWLSPVTVSPNRDFGYDVADYCDVDPVYGDLGLLDRVIDGAGQRGIRILLDLVPNHTSDQHPWFLDALTSRSAAHREWYVWADPTPDGSPPNNWVSTFGGRAWTFHDPTEQYYLHNFLSTQPDLNWWNPEVRQAFDDILAFWWARGVAGFRIDVCTMIVKDAELRDNPPAGPDDSLAEQVFGQRMVYNANRPEAHEVLRHWRRLADAAGPPRLLLGETNVDSIDQLVPYYGDGLDELHLGFNFNLIWAPLEADAMRDVVEETEAKLPPGAWPVWTASNHDVSRLTSRWADGHPDRVKAALVLLLTLRGTPVLYQGDEIGLPDGEITRDQLQDPIAAHFWPAYKGRDPERTPMPWRPVPGGGFTEPDVSPWLPMTNPKGCDVETQRQDQASVLQLAKRMIEVRRQRTDLSAGAYQSQPSPEGTWVYTRGRGTAVALNLSDAPTVVPELIGTLLVSTDAAREVGTTLEQPELGPWEALVLALPGHHVDLRM